MPSTDPNALKFEKAAEALENACFDLKTQWEFPSHKFSQESDEHDDAWLAADISHRELLDGYAQEWAYKRTLPQLTDEQCYWFRLRFDTAGRFLRQFVLEDRSTVFSCEPMPTSELHHWLLVDWWDSVGSLQALYYVIDLPRPGPRPSRN